jgi:signal peptidase I
MADDKTKTTQDRITPETRPHPGQEHPLPARRETPATSPAAKTKPQPKKAPAETVKDTWREIVETVVFVVVLVLLLKSFAAEAFVIPTGSMAETLYGYQKWVKCSKCQFEFPVNCSSEVEDKVPVRGCVCPNCRFKIAFTYAESTNLFEIQDDAVVFNASSKESQSFQVDSDTKMTLDGQEIQLLNKIREAKRVRVICQVGDNHARWVEGITKGSFPENEELYDPSCNSGDRVLVAKYLGDTHLLDFERFDVVVFKFPEEPQHNYEAKNYIKRLIALPGETIGIYGGDLYIGHGIKYPEQPLEEEMGLPRRRQMHRNYEPAKRLLENQPPAKKGDRKEPYFEILRKPPAKVLAMRRIVYDNNHPARDLIETNFPLRWAAEKEGSDPAAEDYLDRRQRAASEGAWVPDDANGFQHPARTSSELDWLRYRHILRPPNDSSRRPEPEVITDFIGYNPDQKNNWVGDLILECKIDIKENEGDLILELSKGEDRFQARWQLTTGFCTLVRHGKDGKDEELRKEQTSLTKPGTYKVRFANVDQRLIVWVDGSLPFGDGVEYHPPADRKDEERNPHNLEPAGIGVRAAGVQIRDLVLWRDTYYTEGPMTLYVQPGHYLCLGDNSPQSSDSRSWGPTRNRHPDDAKGGLVPEELMLGRALMVYWPYYRAGTIR